MVTATQKVNRRAIKEKYSKEIDDCYANQSLDAVELVDRPSLDGGMRPLGKERLTLVSS